MDADDNLEQENDKSPKKKAPQASGIAMEALAGLLDSYSTTGAKVRRIDFIQTILFFFNRILVQYL